MISRQTAIILGLAGLVVGLCLYGARGLLEGAEMRSEIGKALIQLALVVTAGGLVQLLLARRDALKQEAQKEQEFRRSVMASLGKAHAEVYRARRKLRFDRSSVAYTDHVAKLIDVRILLGEVGHDFANRSARYGEAVRTVTEDIRDYLEEIIDEYEALAVDRRIAGDGDRPIREMTPALSAFLARPGAQEPATYEGRFKQPYQRAKELLGYTSRAARDASRANGASRADAGGVQRRKEAAGEADQGARQGGAE